MIDANELMLGNWLLHRECSSVVVESITKTGINFTNYYEGYNETPFESLKGLPLTKELCDQIKYESAITDDLHFQINDGNIFIEQYSEGECHLSHVEYLHELQNLYFWLFKKHLDLSFLNPYTSCLNY